MRERAILAIQVDQLETVLLAITSRVVPSSTMRYELEDKTAPTRERLRLRCYNVSSFLDDVKLKSDMLRLSRTVQREKEVEIAMQLHVVCAFVTSDQWCKLLTCDVVGYNMLYSR